MWEVSCVSLVELGGWVVGLACHIKKIIRKMGFNISLSIPVFFIIIYYYDYSIDILSFCIFIKANNLNRNELVMVNINNVDIMIPVFWTKKFLQLLIQWFQYLNSHKNSYKSINKSFFFSIYTCLKVVVSLSSLS